MSPKVHAESRELRVEGAEGRRWEPIPTQEPVCRRNELTCSASIWSLIPAAKEQGQAAGSLPSTYSPLAEFSFPPEIFPVNIMHRNEKVNSQLWTEGHGFQKVILWKTLVSIFTKTLGDEL